MARSLAVLPLLACLSLFTGCGHEARVSQRNVQQAGEFLAEQGPDDVVRAAGRAIAMQAKASADQADLLFWGLLTRRTDPTITKQDWVDSAPSAERRSEQQAYKVERETERVQAISGTIFASVGMSLGLTGTGVLGLLAAWAFKNQSVLREGLDRAVSFASRVKDAKPGAEVEKIRDDFRQLPKNAALEKALAKRKPPGKVG